MQTDMLQWDSWSTLTVIRKTGLKALGVETLVFDLFIGMSGLLISLLGQA